MFIIELLLKGACLIEKHDEGKSVYVIRDLVSISDLDKPCQPFVQHRPGVTEIQRAAEDLGTRITRAERTLLREERASWTEEDHRLRRVEEGGNIESLRAYHITMRHLGDL